MDAASRGTVRFVTRRILATVVINGLALVAPPALAKPMPVSPRLQTFFGPENVAVMQGPGAIEIARVRKDGDGYVIEQVARPAAMVAGAFRKVLLDNTTYDLPAIGESDMKLCGSFQPAIVVRFQKPKAKRPVDVLLAFNCNEAAIAKPADIPKKLAKKGKYAAGPNFRADMAPGHGDLLKLVLHVFPHDSDLKAHLAEEQAYGLKK
jgi:hypothetical protein